MVAVQMADEDVVEAHEFESHAPHAQLGTLAAVDHHEVVAHVKHLARGTVPRGHCGAAAAQYVEFQPCHDGSSGVWDDKITNNPQDQQTI